VLDLRRLADHPGELDFRLAVGGHRRFRLQRIGRGHERFRRRRRAEEVGQRRIRIHGQQAEGLGRRLQGRVRADERIRACG
jgi:hypothetical protein